MIYEMRTYRLTVGGAEEFEENFSKVIEKRNEVSPIMGFFHTEVGDLNRVRHIWQYESMDHRAEVRAKTVSMDWWPPPNGHLILEQESTLLTAPRSGPNRAWEPTAASMSSEPTPCSPERRARC